MFTFVWASPDIYHVVKFACHFFFFFGSCVVFFFYILAYLPLVLICVCGLYYYKFLLYSTGIVFLPTFVRTFQALKITGRYSPARPVVQELIQSVVLQLAKKY